MNISTLCLLGSLLVSASVLANGNIPVLELDFTRSATETLKKHGINDACIIVASNPSGFTYCREGSATLWKYQARDLNLPGGQGPLLASLDDGRISIAEDFSPACEEELPKPTVDPAIIRAIAISMIVLFLIIGLRFTYKATMEGYFTRTVYSGTHIQRSTSSPHAHRSASKALGAFAIAAAVTFIYFGSGAF
ncbi:hypothetical protein K9857_03480 [Pseudomonas sp. REP124]|uniref:hypothetical protein n=1 Tax=Pseudomonas sp. REP124 TaxID=2875731 RepID=UPI001CCA4876|nr:hypothetical protein [Pseudomonas sp. REP124]MBZ9780611.1 hypothetical protein [Pseudomonas sp. REP124]